MASGVDRIDFERTPLILRARWVFPGDREPIENASVLIEADRIADMSTAADPRAVDLGNMAILPGLINAHTHLELSDLREPLAPVRPFADWIKRVVGHRRERRGGRDEGHSVKGRGTRDEGRQGRTDAIDAVQHGLEESVAAGTTLVADIAVDESYDDERLSDPLCRVVAFREIIGFLPEQVAPQLRVAEAYLHSTGQSPQRTKLVRGLSPHAPYSVSPELFQKLVDRAARRSVPLAVHLAETEAELELLSRGTGELVEMLRQFGAWQPGVIAPGSRPLDYLRMLGDVPALVVHGNYLADDELDYVAAHPNLTVVYCPRTHAFFGHRAHPWLRLLDRGGAVAIGTDSRASNPDLSVWRELQFLHARYPRVDPRTLLKLATANGGAALLSATKEPGLGRIAAGGPADLTVVRLPVEQSAPFASLFHPASAVTATMCAGRWVKLIESAGGVR